MSPEEKKVVIQCPTCQTTFEVAKIALERVGKPKFHCSRCDSLFIGFEHTPKEIATPPLEENQAPILTTQAESESSLEKEEEEDQYDSRADELFEDEPQTEEHEESEEEDVEYEEDSNEDDYEDSDEEDSEEEEEEDYEDDDDDSQYEEEDDDDDEYEDPEEEDNDDKFEEEELEEDSDDGENTFIHAQTQKRTQPTVIVDREMIAEVQRLKELTDKQRQTNDEPEPTQVPFEFVAKKLDKSPSPTTPPVLEEITFPDEDEPEPINEEHYSFTEPQNEEPDDLYKENSSHNLLEEEDTAELSAPFEPKLVNMPNQASIPRDKSTNDQEQTGDVVVGFAHSEVEHDELNQEEPGLPETFDHRHIAPEIAAQASLTRTLSVIGTPLILFLAVLFFAGEYLKTDSTATRTIYSSLFPNSPQVAPAGLRIQDLTFSSITLTNGKRVPTISGAIVNRSESAYRKVLLEGVIFDKEGGTLKRTLTSLSNDLTREKLTGLTPEVITELQAGEEHLRKSLKPGEKREFLLAFPGTEKDLKFYTARIYSVLST